jgi:hypothetical protein
VVKSCLSESLGGDNSLISASLVLNTLFFPFEPPLRFADADGGVLVLDLCFFNLFDVADVAFVVRLIFELFERFNEFASRVVRFDVCKDVFARRIPSSLPV